MKKLFVRTGLALVCSVAASAFAYDLTLNDTGLKLTVNGQDCLDDSSAPALIDVNVNGTTINITTSGEEFSCGGISGLPPSSASSSSSVASSSVSSSSSSSSAGGTPAPGVDLSACGGSWPTDVIQGAVLSLSGEPRAAQSLNGNRTISFPVQTLVAGAQAKIDITANSGTMSVTRDMWISACPGGPALEAGRCSGMGVDAITLRTKQANSASALYCLLEDNKQYFINVSNQNCGSSTTNCGFYRAIK